MTHCLFLGGLCKQTPAAFFAWEEFFGSINFKRFIELGMGFSNMSVFFLLHCMNKHAQYTGYEHAMNFSAGNSVVKRALQLKRHRRTLDFHTKEVIEEIHQLIGRPGTSIVFCDGGNKPLEFELYAPALKLKDYIAVHDYGTEAKAEQLQDTIDKNCLWPVVPESWRGTLTRVWMKGD